MDSALLTDVSGSPQPLSDPLLCGTSSGVLQQNMLPYDNTSTTNLLQYPNKMFDAQTALPSMPMNRTAMNMQQSQIQHQTQMLGQNTSFLSAPSDASVSLQTMDADALSNLSGAKKRQQMARSPRFQFGRRDPPNYDKTAPTQHQTALYNQIIAQQNATKMQLQQQPQQQQLPNSMSTVVSNAPLYSSINQRYQSTDINR